MTLRPQRTQSTGNIRFRISLNKRWFVVAERRLHYTTGALAARGTTLQGRARGSSGLRREERSGAMVPHRDRRTTKSVIRSPLRPTGYGGIGPSATLPLLDRWCHRLDRGADNAIPKGPTAMGYGGIGPSATLPLLDRWCHRLDRCRTSTSSWRLAYGPMALVTRSLQGCTTGC